MSIQILQYFHNYRSGLLYLVDISYTYTGTIGVLLTIILSTLVSLMTGNIEIIHIINELKSFF